MCGGKAKCGKAGGGNFRLPGGTCLLVAEDFRDQCHDGCLECGGGKGKGGKDKKGKWSLSNLIEPGYACVEDEDDEDRRRLDEPAARPAWAVGAPQEKASPRLPSWASQQHRRLGGGKGSCYIPGDDEFLPVCRPVGKCGKGGDGSCLEDEDQCVDDFGGTFCSGKDGGKGKDNGGKGKDNGGKGKDNGGKGKKGKKGKKDGKKR